MNDAALKFRIGVFVLASFVIMALLVILFSGFPSLFSQQNRYVVLLDNAVGVGAGTPVRRSGVRIGEVENVDLDDETGEVRVTILVNKKYVLRRNEVPVLTRNLLGDSAIDFQTENDKVEDLGSSEEEDPPGKDDQKPKAGKGPDRSVIPPGSVLKGRVSPDAQKLLDQAGKVLPNTEQAIRELGKAAESFNKIAPDLNQAIREIRDLSRATRETVPDLRKTNDEALITLRNWGRLGERLYVLVRTEQDKFIKALQDIDETMLRIGRAFSDENQRNLSTTLKNAATASDNLDSIAKNADGMLKDSRQTLQRMNHSLERADELMITLQKASKPFADRSDRVMKNLDEASDRLNKTLIDVQALVQAFSRADGTFSRLMNDPALYNNLNDLTCMLLHILPRVDRVMKDMEIFADKIARHPESLGVGGAVRPSSGIK